jgi:TonB family protein
MNRKLKFANIVAFVSVSLLAARPAHAMPVIRHAGASVVLPAPYPNSTDGLHQLVTDMLEAQKSGGPQALSKYLPTLVLPDAATWFTNAFGDDNGMQLAIFYAAWSSYRDSQLSGDVARALAERMTQIEVLRFDKQGDPGTTEKDNYFLGICQQPEPLYVVNLKSASGASMRWAYFVFSDDAFRYLGPLPDLRLVAKTGLPSEIQSSPELTQRVRVGGNVMTSKIEHQVPPVYPPDALAAHVEGDVVLHSILAKDGSVKELQYISGPPLLMRAAMDAVRQWRYTPFLLNGQPVEVDTSIDVKFSLASSASGEAPSAPAGPKSESASPTSAASIPSFPDSTGGLTKMMKAMLDMAKRGDNQGLESFYQALVLPDPASWFSAQFGTQQGGQFAQSYGPVARYLEAFFNDTIQSDPNLQSSHVEVRRIKDACGSDANESEYPLLTARENQSTPLYEVRFVKDLGYRLLFPFVYVDGGFRYLGNLQIQAPQNHFAMPRPSDTASDSSDSGVQMPKLIKEVQAVFPTGFNMRNAGVVKLWGVIGTDGSVRDLHVIEGTCEFARATMDAVKKWRFTPLMVNGQPQEMFYPFQYNFGPAQ